ncbi:MAG: AAA family ATPase [Candidatus Nezhaarchaeales archaeon]
MAPKGLVIAVSGKPGAGKTTYAKAISQALNIRYVSIGSLFREIALKKGVDLLGFHRIAEGDAEYDLTVDRLALEEARKGNVIVEGHLAGWTLRDIADLKIFFTVPLEVGALRISKRDGKPFEEALQEVKFREESNRRRYLKIYGYDIADLTIYDLVVNTDKWSKEFLVEAIIGMVKNLLKLA